MLVFPPAFTWFRFIACAAFQAAVTFMCFHEKGPQLAKRGPTILGRWLNHRRGTASSIEIQPPSSVAQSWRLGALHERFFKGYGAGEESILHEAGLLLGVGRSLTEEEFLSLARVSAGTARRSRWCCNLSDCLFFTGIVGGICMIGPALYYVTTPIHSLLEKIVTMMILFGRGTPMFLRCLLTLTVSLALVCDGFRAVDSSIGSRIALTGVAGAIATMYYSTMLTSWDDAGGSWEQASLLLGFSACVTTPIAVAFDFPFGGFIAVVCTYWFGLCSSRALDNNRYNSFPRVLNNLCGSLLVIFLFCLAVFYRVKPRIMQPFMSGVMATGVFAVHLALFMNSCEHRGFQLMNMFAQVPVLACLAGGWVLGKKVGCEGLKNNSRLFGFLYLFATIISYLDRLPGRDRSALVWMVVFVGLWRVGLFLRGHKGFVASLWALDAGLVSGANSENGDNGGGGKADLELLLGEGLVLEMETDTPRSFHNAE